MVRLTRVLGALTALYGVAIVAKPEILARPCGLVGPDERVPAGMRALITGIGARDAASGIAMVLAPPGRALRTATLVRVASDWSDAVGFGLALPDRQARLKVAAVASAWGAVCAVAGLSGRSS